MNAFRINLLVFAGQCFSGVALLISSTVLIGYFVNSAFLLSWGYNQQMAFPTAIAFFCNSLAIQIGFRAVAGGTRHLP